MLRGGICLMRSSASYCSALRRTYSDPTATFPARAQGVPGGVQRGPSEVIGSLLLYRLRPHSRSGSSLKRLTLQKIRTDVRLLPDRIVVAEHVVGEQRVACDDGVLVEFHRIQSDHRGLLAAVPFERR